MPKLIVKWRYIKGGTPKHGEHLVKYIATREGVEKCDESWKEKNATREQTRLIDELMQDFPSTKQSHEYEDYIRYPNKYTASQLINRAIDENIDLIGRKENYIGYIANRPNVEKQGTHGLFCGSDEPIDLDEVAHTVATHKGLVWTTVFSLKREDAERLGYDNAKAWKELLRDKSGAFAKAMNIPLEDMRWYGAFHNEGSHPHIHLVSYSVGKEPYMTEGRLHKMKSVFANEIFRQDLYHIHNKQTMQRDKLREEGSKKARELVSKVYGEGCSNEKIENILNELIDKLKEYSGKKVYGYLPEDMKKLVDGIVDELAKDKNIQELYDLWYEQKEETIKVYKDTMPKRVPLSSNEEFRSIRNAVLKEAVNILNMLQSEQITADKSDGEKNEKRFTGGGKQSSKHTSQQKNNDKQAEYVAVGSFRLLGRLARLLEGKIQEPRDGKLGHTDRKLRREINEKKQAQGIKLE